MKALTKIILIAVLLSIMAGVCFADIPHLINYQGKLTDKDSKPVSDGSYSVTFRIYDHESAGNLLWSETQSVSVSKGIFNVLLGGATALNLAFDKPYWLEIKVGDEVMSPRQRMASAPYAFTAEYGVPRGAIVMWSGSIASIPDGWALCDGTNGTPDLRDKFVVGARQDNSGLAKTNITGSLTQSGGSTAISTDNLPPHTHGSGGVHAHTLISSAYNGHQRGPLNMGVEAGTIATSNDGVHTHSSVGSGMPYIQPYYALAYIMKL
jgi:hypothetical protein